MSYELIGDGKHFNNNRENRYALSVSNVHSYLSMSQIADAKIFPEIFAWLGLKRLKII